jgi:protein-L-isoaspartate(D-aspartate) O-methyltransferase
MQQRFEEERENMVEGQILPHKVRNPDLIDALRHIPREMFLPPALQSLAYTDDDIPLGHGRYLPEPMVLARLLQEANIQRTDKALDIGCGTGYSSAIMASLAAEVYGIEQEQKMAVEAARLLGKLGISNAHVMQENNIRDGYAKRAPYNVILINGAVAAVPDKIKSQLADGGRLVTVVTRRGRVGAAVIVTRHGDSFLTRELFDAATPVLAGFEAPPSFVF